MSQDIDQPANSPAKPSWATIRLMTLKVDEETSVDTEKKEDKKKKGLGQNKMALTGRNVIALSFEMNHSVQVVWRCY